MSTPSTSDPGTPEKSSAPASPPSAEGTSVEGANDKPPALPVAPASSQAPHNVPAPRDWSSLPELQESHLRPALRRRLLLPVVLFVATCASTFWVGAAHWRPQSFESL